MNVTGTKTALTCEAKMTTLFKGIFLIMLFFPSVGVVAEQGPSEIAIWTNSEKNEIAEKGELQVLFRTTEDPLSSEMDVMTGSGVVVSFVTSYGVANHAVCESIFVNKNAWFALCRVFNHPFSSPGELVRELSSKDLSLIGAYFMSGDRSQCEAVDVTSAADETIALQILAEVASWSNVQQVAFSNSFKIIGSYGTPRLGQMIRSFWHFDQSPIVDESQLRDQRGIPEEILVELDSFRINGIGGWLNGLVTKQLP